MKPSVVFLKNSGINLFVQGILILVSVVSVPILIRNLGLAQYGLFILIQTFIGYVSILGSSVTDAFIKYGSESHAKKNMSAFNSYFWISLSASTVLGIVAALLLYFGSQWYMEIGKVITVEISSFYNYAFLYATFYVAVFFLGNAFWSVPQAVQRFEYSTIKDFLFGAIAPIGAIAIVLTGGNVVDVIKMYFMVSLFFLFLFTVLTIRLCSNKILKPVLRISFLGPIIRFATAKLVSATSGQVTFQTDRAFLGAYYSISLLPFYSVPLSLAQRASFFVMNIVPAAFPFFSSIEAQGGNEQLQRGFGKVSKWVNIVAIFLYMFLIFFAQHLLSIWLGENFSRKSSILLQILSLTYLVFSFSAIPSTMFESIGKPHIPMFFSLSAAVMQILLFILLIPRYGNEGAAFALLSNAFIWVPAYILYVFKKSTINIKKLLWQTYIVPILAAVLSLAPISFLISANTSRVFLFLLLGVSLFTGVFIYGSLLLFVEVIDKEDRKFLKNFATIVIKRIQLYI